MSHADPTVLAAIILGSCSLVAAVVAAWASITSNKRTKTNHGKTIGQHVEDAAADAAEAKLAAQLVALQLAEYKLSQANENEALRTTMALNTSKITDTLVTHTQSDADNFAELRQLIVLSKRDTP